MNYQGVSSRRDFAAFAAVFYFLVTYYPMLSLALVVVLVVSSFWGVKAIGGGVRGFVNLVSKPGGGK